MKIKKISRKVTGKNYDNIELEAELAVADDIYEVANQLDELARNLMDDIYEKKYKKEVEKNKKLELKRKTERFLDIIEGSTVEEINKIINDNELPF